MKGLSKQGQESHLNSHFNLFVSLNDISWDLTISLNLFNELLVTISINIMNCVHQTSKSRQKREGKDTSSVHQMSVFLCAYKAKLTASQVLPERHFLDKSSVWLHVHMGLTATGVCPIHSSLHSLTAHLSFPCFLLPVMLLNAFLDISCSRNRATCVRNHIFGFLMVFKMHRHPTFTNII